MVIKTQNSFELCYQGMNRKRLVSHDDLNDTGTFCYCNQAPSLARPKSQLPHIVHTLLLSSQDQNTIHKLRVEEARPLYRSSEFKIKHLSDS